MDRPLKQVVRDHFDRHQLSAQQFERLESMMADHAQQPENDRSSQSRRHALRWSVAIAATMLIALTAVLQTSWLDSRPMSERIALEVARNHINLKPMDVTTGSMTGIRQYFSDLEFVPVESALLATTGLKLMGGRYCSIQSVPAAQLRMASAPDGGAVQTFYQTEYREDMFGPLPALERGETPLTVSVKGLDVDIWVEKGLLLALAREPGSPAARQE